MRTVKLLIASASVALLFAGCNVDDPIYETPHPDKGQITLTTDWSGIGSDITKPASWTASYGVVIVPVSAETYTFPNLLEPANYTIYAYNAADHIAVSGTTATADYATGSLGWFFTGKLQAEVKKDTDHEFTVNMKQQVRQLTLMLELTGGTIDRITSITGTLSGVAGSYDFDSGTHAAATSIALTFAKNTDGDYNVPVRLLGVAGTGQKLNITLTYNDGTPQEQLEEYDLTSLLADFNGDKKTPLTLGSQIVETPTQAGFTAVITDWKQVNGGIGIAK